MGLVVPVVPHLLVKVQLSILEVVVVVRLCHQ
jgi:hypothetical protein